MDLSGSEWDDDGDVTDGDGHIFAAGTMIPAGEGLIVGNSDQASWVTEYGTLPTGYTFYDSSADWEQLNNTGDMIGISGGSNNGSFTDLADEGEAIIWDGSAFVLGGVVTTNTDCGAVTYNPGVAGSDEAPSFTAIAVCDSNGSEAGGTQASANLYYVEVTLTNAGSAGSGNLSVNVGGNTATISSASPSAVLGTFSFTDGTAAQTVTVSSVANPSHSSTAEVSEILCGFTPDNGPATDSNIHASGFFCTSQASLTASAASPAIIVQAAPGSVTQGQTNDADYVYVIVDATGNVVAVNNSGLFSGLMHNVAYTIHAFNVEKSDQTAFESAFVVGDPYAAPTSTTQCFTSCGSTTITPDCFECPTLNAMTDPADICCLLYTSDAADD